MDCWLMVPRGGIIKTPVYITIDVGHFINNGLFKSTVETVHGRLGISAVSRWRGELQRKTAVNITATANHLPNLSREAPAWYLVCF